MANGLQQLGAFVGCIIVWPITHRLGRKWALVICSAVFCLGALVQTINTHSRTVFYVFRVVAGLGLGGASLVVPMYSSEMSPKHLRGQIGSFFQLFYTFGMQSSMTVFSVASNQARHLHFLLGRLRRRSRYQQVGIPSMANPSRPAAHPWCSPRHRHAHSQGVCALAHPARST